MKTHWGKLMVIGVVLLLSGVVHAQYTFTTNNGAITITGYTGSNGNVIIPSTTNGYPVTSIGTNAFNSMIILTNVIIPDSITNIDYGAFLNCSRLTNVTFGNSVISIGANAFMYCTHLKSVTIPDSVTSIGIQAFMNCWSNANVTIGNGVTSIGDNAFDDCSSLTNVTFGNSVASIGRQAFAVCAMTSVMIPASVTNIGGGPFNGCSGLTNIAVNAGNTRFTSVGGVLFNQSMTLLIQFPAGLTGSYAIPDSVTIIGDSAFGICHGLTNVTMGNGIISIGFSAFSGSVLTSVTIPASVTNIGDFAFGFSSLHQAFFLGNAPSVNGVAGSTNSNVFAFDSGTAYYLPNNTGWGATFGSWPTVLWNPQVQTTNNSFGIRTNQFGFNLTGNASIPVVVEACTNMGGAWLPVFSGSVTNGSIFFSDPQSTNYPQRFYRVRSP